MRRDPVPTPEQLLILADRAERGPLTAAEASRLRAGIRAAAEVAATRRSISAQLRELRHHAQRQERQLAAVRGFFLRAQRRGAQTVALWALGRAIDGIDVPGRPVEVRRARQGPSVPVSRPNSARGSPATSGAENGAQSPESSIRRSS